MARNSRIDPESVWYSSLAGTWYPSQRHVLREEIEGYLDHVEESGEGDLCGLVLPHAGYRYSGQTAAYGIKRILGRDFSRVVILGPSHFIPMENRMSAPKAAWYSNPLGRIPLDVEFLELLFESDHMIENSFLHEQEHSVQIEIPLLQVVLEETPIVPIVVGKLDAETTKRIAQTLLDLIDDRTLIVASSDFTHYGPRFDFVPFQTNIPENIRKLDMGAYEKIVERDVSAFKDYCLDTGATICGRDAIGILLAMLRENSATELLHYDTSGNLTGDWENSVSYLSVGFSGKWAHPSEVALCS